MKMKRSPKHVLFADLEKWFRIDSKKADAGHPSEPDMPEECLVRIEHPRRERVTRRSCRRMCVFVGEGAIVANLHSKILDCRTPGRPNSFNFMQFFGKFCKNCMLAPPEWLVPSPRGNPGSATG